MVADRVGLLIKVIREATTRGTNNTAHQDKATAGVVVVVAATNRGRQASTKATVNSSMEAKAAVMRMLRECFSRQPALHCPFANEL